MKLQFLILGFEKRMLFLKILDMYYFSFLHSDIEIGLIGSHVDLTYEYEYLGDSANAIDGILSGKGNFAEVIFCNVIVLLKFEELLKISYSSNKEKI